MFSFNNLTFRSKIVGSFVILILLTAVLVAASVYKISSTREITIDKIENLNVRYERTRQALDSFYNLHFQVRKIVTDAENSETYISESEALIDKAKKLLMLCRQLAIQMKSVQLKATPRNISIHLTTC